MRYEIYNTVNGGRVAYGTLFHCWRAMVTMFGHKVPVSDAMNASYRIRRA